MARVIPEEASGGSGGDVVGPGLSSDDAIATFNGVDGLSLQSSGASVTDAGTVVSSGLSLIERADHAEAPSAGSGQLWADDAIGSPLIYTNDIGTDAVVSNAARNAIAASVIDWKNGSIQTRTITTTATFTASNYFDGGTILLELLNSGATTEPTWPATTITIGTGAWDVTDAVKNYVFIACIDAATPTFAITISQAA